MDGDTSVLDVTNQARTWISTLQSELVGGHNGELPARCAILVGAYTSALLLELVPADAYSHGQSDGLYLVMTSVAQRTHSVSGDGPCDFGDG
jgi:hypothetical protein